MYIYRILFTAIIILCSLSFCPASTNIPDSITVDMSSGPIHIEGATYDTVLIKHTANCSIITIGGLNDSSKYVVKFLFHPDSVPLFLIVKSKEKYVVDLINDTIDNQYEIKTNTITFNNSLSIFYRKPVQFRARFTHIYYPNQNSSFANTKSCNSNINETLLFSESSIKGTIKISKKNKVYLTINRVKDSLAENLQFYKIHYDIESRRIDLEDIMVLERLNYKSSEDSIFNQFEFNIPFINDSSIHTFKDLSNYFIKNDIDESFEGVKKNERIDPVLVNKEIYLSDDSIYNELNSFYDCFQLSNSSDRSECFHNNNQNKNNIKSTEELQILYGIVTNDERYKSKNYKDINGIINNTSTLCCEDSCFSIASQSGIVKIYSSRCLDESRILFNTLNNKLGSVLYTSGLAFRKSLFNSTAINFPIDRELSLSKIKSMLSFYIKATYSLSKKESNKLFNFDETTYLNNSLLLEQNVLQLHKKHLDYLKGITDYQIYRDVFREIIEKKKSKTSERLNLILILVTLLIGIFLYDVPDSKNQKPKILSNLKVLESLYLSLTIITVFMLAILLYLEVYTSLEFIFWFIAGFSGLTLLLKIIRTFCLIIRF